MEELRKYIDEIIYEYDPETNTSCIRYVDNIVVKQDEAYLRYDCHDGVICTIDNLENTTPDCAGYYYFKNRKALEDFRKSLKNKNII